MNPILRLDLTRVSIDRAKRRFLPLACAMALMLPVAPSSAFGELTGRTYARQDDGSMGPAIPNVAVSFVKEDGAFASTTKSDLNGRYSASLSPGRYYVLASHPQYEDYAPGYVVVGLTSSPVDLPLRKPGVTTVLIVRHGEKLHPNESGQSEPLSDHGNKRAQRLRAILLRAGISAVYSTDMVRTKNTVGPLARLFRLPVHLYPDHTALAGMVLREHTGDVVLVAAHSDTVGAVANAFGGDVSTNAITDYDNLYVVSMSGKARNVVNLQYGVDSQSDLTKNNRHAMTLLLVGTSVGSNTLEPQELLHAASSARVTAIFSSVEGNPLLAPLATALNLAQTPFDGGDMEGFANQLISTHPQDTVVVGGTKAERRELIHKLGGSPFPVLYNDDVDHLIVVTRFKSGVVRVVPMRF